MWGNMTQMLNYFQKDQCRVRVSQWWGPHRLISHLESTLLNSMHDTLPEYVDYFSLKHFKLKLNLQSDISEEYVGNVGRIVSVSFLSFFTHSSFYVLTLRLHKKNRSFHDKKSLLADCLLNCHLFVSAPFKALDVTYFSS